MEEDFFSSVCSLLDIHEPDVEYSSKGFPSKTMAAMYLDNDDTIYINKNPDISLGCKLFGIASALRAAWQYKTNLPIIHISNRDSKLGLRNITVRSL